MNDEVLSIKVITNNK